MVLPSSRGKGEFDAFILPRITQHEPGSGCLGDRQLREAQILLGTEHLGPSCRHFLNGKSNDFIFSSLLFSLSSKKKDTLTLFFFF